MRSFLLYGLDLADKVLASETLEVEGLDTARRLARERLHDFPKVEVWSEAVCVFRGRRRPTASEPGGATAN